MGRAGGVRAVVSAHGGRPVAAARHRQVKLGAYVTFEGRAWQVAAVAGAWVRLVDEDGQTASVLAPFLFADPTFAVVDSPAPGVVPWGLMESVPVRERERALAWQRTSARSRPGCPAARQAAGCPGPNTTPSSGRWLSGTSPMRPPAW